MAKTEKTTSIDLSEDITYFNYYTKRKNRFFFTAWINDVYSHIIVEIQSGNITIEFTGEPNKNVFLKAGQQELILEACKNELRKRKVKAFLELEAEEVEESNMNDEIICEIKEVDGVEKATIIVPMSAGEVVKEKVSEDGKTHTIAVGMYTESTMNYFERALYERAEHIDFKDFKELLDTYFSTRLCHTVGLKETPLRRNPKGEIEGLREDVILKDYTKEG